MIRYLLLIWIFLLPAGLCAQDSLLIPNDRAREIDSRSFEENLREKYNGEEFNYRVNEGEPQNLLRRFFRWLSEVLLSNFGIDISPTTLKIMEYVVYVLMGSLVIFLLVRFFIGENLSSIFTKKATPINSVDLYEKNIEEVDLDGLIRSAMEKGDFRLAIRYQYLKVLKQLSQKNLITWHYEKTNADYQSEIKQPALQSLFREVSYLYDYIWYGEQQIDSQGYQAAELRFAAIKKQLNV